MKRFLYVILGLIMSLSSAVSAKDLLDHVILKWKPTTEVSTFKSVNYSALLAHKIKLGTFTDSRIEKKLIGENVEKENKLPVSTDSKLEDFIRAGVNTTFKDLGLSVVDSNPDYTLNFEITKFFITEKNTYVGTLVTKVNLVKSGKVVWSDVAMGSNKRFGRSYKLENYLETSSDLVIDLLLNLFKKPEFMNQFKSKAKK